MRRLFFQSLLLLALITVRITTADEIVSQVKEESKPFGLTARVPWTTSRVVGTPEPPPPYTVQRAFPNVEFENPVCIAQEPGTNRFMVGENNGKIYAFTKDTPNTESRELFLDTGRSLYAFSFHPDYEHNGYVFTHSPNGPSPDVNRENVEPVDSTEDTAVSEAAESSSTEDGLEETDLEEKYPDLEYGNRGVRVPPVEALPPHKRSRVSRFQATGTTSRRCLPESETIIIEWPSGGHNGGEAIIGPDGYLYISTGDGSIGSDPKQTGQGVDDLLAVIMRIDVEHPADGKAYSIPQDNPFVDYPGARPEIWAFGFRNPWRISFDSKTGGLWVGDVGQDLWEMIWLVQRGGNYGWSIQEGGHPFHPNQPIGPGPILPPVVEHHHVECRSITGGYVYYGEKFPELDGVYFYGDYQYGMLWGVRVDGQQAIWHEVLANTALQVSSFGVSRDGDIYMLDYLSSAIYELTRAEEAEDHEDFPQKLSETGLFSSVSNHEVAPGVIHYSVNTPQWVDGGTKERFIALPGDTRIKFVERSGDASTWVFEDGTVNIETISLEFETGNSASRRRIETRMMVKQTDKEEYWLGYSYLWNDEQTDATLVEANGLDIPLTIRDASVPGSERQQTWHVPSRNECMVCHSRAAGFVLGPRTEQMNRDHAYPHAVDNQLRTLNHIDLFEEALVKSPQDYESLPNAYDPVADLDTRARAYLHVNCAGCHVADGGGNAKMDMKHHQTLQDTKLTDAAIHGTFGLTGARIVVPGDPYSSVLLYRMAKWGRGRMPHVGSNLHDEQGLHLVHEWISRLPGISNDHQRTEANQAEVPQGLNAEELLQRKEEANRLRIKAEQDRVRDLKAAATRRSAVDAETRAVAESLKRAEQMVGEPQVTEISTLLSTSRTALMLARFIQQRPAVDGLRQQVVAMGAAHTDANIRDLFERFLPEKQRTSRLGNSINMADLLKLDGNIEQGRKFFFTATASQCNNCHRLEEKGGTIGPDLSRIGSKYKPHEILESLIDPSRKIDPKFQTHLLITAAGKTHTGVLVERSERHVILNVFKEGKTVAMRLASDDVEELIPQQKSLMPDGMLRDLTPQQAADLLAFLTSLKQEPLE